MTEKQLLELLTQARTGSEVEVLPAHADQLSFARARELVVHPWKYTPAEQEHVNACRCCRYLIGSFERNLRDAE